ncbi:MAG: hypothetical protein WC675_03620 [Patescibacteria group bacterium]|jgi:hypothetical protein
MQNQDVFELYKPLRNHLRQIDLYGSFYTIWNYSQHLLSNKKFPNDVLVAPEFLSLDQIGKMRMVSLWELETLCKEIIINSQEVEGKKTLKNWEYFANAINKLKKLENDISGKFVDKNNILLEMHRIAHRQFPWQAEKPAAISMTRYYKIFNYEPISEIIKKVTNLSTQELYIIATALFGLYENKFTLFYPTKIEIKGISIKNFDYFLNHFCCDIKTLKEKLLKEQEINEKFAYAFGSLRAYPIIKMAIPSGKDGLVCPLPTLLFWRLTNGIYYEIFRQKDFDNYFGFSFQTYVGEVIKKATYNKKIKYYAEEQYRIGKELKDTIDWIVADEEGTLFIECKTKRMTFGAKTEINSMDELEKELDKAAEFILQVYKAIKDCLDNKYPSYKHRSNKNIFPLIVTLEDWYLFGDLTLEKLNEKIKIMLSNHKIPTSWLDDYPYSICSVSEFEKITQVIQLIDIKEFMSKKVFDQDCKKWNFSPFIGSKFSEINNKIKFLFPEDFDRIFPRHLRGDQKITQIDS